MNVSASQIVDMTLPPRLRDRLRTLCVTVVHIHEDGSMQPQDGSTWLERLILFSPACVANVRRKMDTLRQSTGRAVEIWPGVYLAPLPVKSRRRPMRDHDQPELVAALLLGQELIDSDQLRQLCDHNQLDFLATVAQIDKSSLYNHTEAMRMAEMLGWMQEDSREICRRTNELQTMSRQLSDSYEELSLLYKLSTTMIVAQPPEHYLSEACREMQQVLGLRWLALQLTDVEASLNKLSGKLIIAGPDDIDETRLGAVGMQLLLEHATSTVPRVVDDVTTLHVRGLPQVAHELLMVTIMREGRPLGILFGGDKLDGTHLSSVDSKLCSSLASNMSIFIENTILYEDMHSMFMGTLHALTNSIDAKDSYTHGHSERVALMSRLLAQAAGLDPHVVERVYIAGLIHDVGKIGVPEAVLCKPGHLTQEEFDMIKLHPEIGSKILQDIRQMQDLVPGVLYHHERWDGRGYPHNLRGKEIPLFGRVIGLADAFDAMSSNRTYRQALDHKQVINEIKRCAGSQFDPELAQIFVNLDFTPFYELIQKHQRRVLPIANMPTIDAYKLGGKA